jgi:hypothetical protein
VTFVNEKKESCVVHIKDKVEICGLRRRRIIRKDVKLPTSWIHQSENVKRCPLDVKDSDYNEALTHFDRTMSRKYSDIKIERIQNQRWFTAYRAHRKFSKQKDSEQLLFHGCTSTSADMIIHSYFNRSFAGIHGK